MKPEEFLTRVRLTESTDIAGITQRIVSNARVLHAALGLADETGELVKQVKRAVYYGGDLDRTNCIEELGDMLWFIGLALDALGASFEDAFGANARKLHARYGGHYSQEAALNRDLSQELKALEGESE